MEEKKNDVKNEKDKKVMQETFNNLSEQYLLQGVLARKIQQFVKDNSNNVVLMDYLKMMKSLENCQSAIDKYKSELYNEMEKNKEKKINNDFIDVTCKFAYKRTGFDYKTYFEENPEKEEIKNKYITESTIKGNVTIKEKRTDYKT